MSAVYGVMSNGELLGVADTSERAIELAGPGQSIYFDGPEEDLPQYEQRLAANPGELVQLGAHRVVEAPLSAFRLASLKEQDFGAIMSSMSLDEAWQRLQPFFPTREPHGRGTRPVKAYQTATLMARRLLGQNYKTEKGTPRSVRALVKERTGFSSAKVMGLSLLPHSQVYNTKAPGGEVTHEIVSEAASKYGIERQALVKANVCARATRECSASCLVFSGRNLADDYNTIKKYALMQALWGDTPAFLRMLGEAISRHQRGSVRARVTPLVRLNVFSDIPWELVAPGIFDYFAREERFVQFYDYTKVPARKTPRNYDITFSYAGTEQNVDGMDYEVRTNRRRVAVVFATVGERRVVGAGNVEIPKKPPKGKRGLPPMFMGLPVVDGDESDLRPYDPAPSIVGLRWKNPANQGVTLVQASVFIVRGAMVDGNFICAETPTRTLDYAGVDDEDAAE